MYEGVSNNQGDDNIEQPFDYLAEAERMRQERQAKEAAEKAEKEAKEKQKREERIAKQLAKSAAKREEIAKKAEDLEISTEKAKDQVADVKQEIKGMQKEAGSLPKVEVPQDEVVYKGTAGSEVTTMGLENGEGATIELQHDIRELDGSVKRTEETIALADEVTARAEAVASERDIALDRARSAILSVEANDVSTHTESGSVPYDLNTEQQELGDRIQRTWEGVSPVVSEQFPAHTDTTDEIVLTPYQPVADGGSSNSYEGGMPVLGSEGISHNQGTIERAPDPISPVTSTIKSGVAFMGGLLAGRSRATNLRRSLDRTNTTLAKQTQEIKRDVDAIQTQSAAHEFVIPSQARQMESPAAVRMRAENNIVSSPEIHGTDAPAIPSWIKQVEADIKKGKVVELKKWQQDVLRIQHPELMKQYEKLDYRAKEVIKSQSKETLSAQFAKPSAVPQPLGAPGDLPIPLASMPAYMNPNQLASARPVFDYTNTQQVGQGSEALTTNGYLTIVMIGGVVFGAVLIAAFGF